MTATAPTRFVPRRLLATTAVSALALLAAAGVLFSPVATAAAAAATRGAARPAFCASGGAALWGNLAACGWPGPATTGPDLAKCPGHRLVPMGGSLARRMLIRRPGTVISCRKITGMLIIKAPNVTVRNSAIISNSGRTGESANGTADIFVSDGASATIEHVQINGDDGVHACIWHQGTRLFVNAVNCYGVDDGIWSWADNSYSWSSGDHFTIKNSYFHGFTARTSNGHEDGYQTEGTAHGLIEHNTYLMTARADSAIAIWDGLRSSHDITVRHNLITGGGFAIYAEDYNPGSGAASAGGYSVTRIWFTGNVFSTYASACVGKFGVWFARPAWAPYHGGPTDGWHRHGNRVLETGESIDGSNPQAGSFLCH
jgi:hypothetical protein